jgi:hypothetical protein
LPHGARAGVRNHGPIAGTAATRRPPEWSCCTAVEYRNAGAFRRTCLDTRGLPDLFKTYFAKNADNSHRGGRRACSVNPCRPYGRGCHAAWPAPRWVGRRRRDDQPGVVRAVALTNRVRSRWSRICSANGFANETRRDRVRQLARPGTFVEARLGQRDAPERGRRQRRSSLFS